MAEKGFSISVYNRSGDKTDAAVARAKKEGVGERLHGAAQRECGAQLCTVDAKELCLRANVCRRWRHTAVIRAKHAAWAGGRIQQLLSGFFSLAVCAGFHDLKEFVQSLERPRRVSCGGSTHKFARVNGTRLFRAGIPSGCICSSSH